MRASKKPFAYFVLHNKILKKLKLFTYKLYSESESEVAQLCPTVSDPMDCSPPGSSVHGIFQARVLEWGAIAFSDKLYKNTYKHMNCVDLHDQVFLQLINYVIVI